MVRVKNRSMFSPAGSLSSDRKISLEFFKGTKSIPVISNGVNGSMKLIFDNESHKFTVFHPLGKDSIPKFKTFRFALLEGYPGMIDSLTSRKSKWWTEIRWWADRICIEDKDGNFACLKSNSSNPSLEDAKDILNVKKSALKHFVETGKQPDEVGEEDL